MQSINRSSLIIPERGGLVLPRHITTRPRTPPKMRGTGKLKGRIRWELKRAGKVIAGGEQENLITNVGLDSFAECSDGWFTQFRSHGGVGTGSTTPAFTDTTIEGEVMTVSGSNSSRSDVWDTPNNQQITKATRKYVFNFTAAYNLNKFGFKAGASGSASVVQVFKGGAGTQITISVLANDQLTIYHELEIAFGPVGANVAASLDIVEKDRTGGVLGTITYTGWATFYGKKDVALYPLGESRAAVFSPGAYLNYFYRCNPSVVAADPDDPPSNQAVSEDSTYPPEVYISGTHKRTKRKELSENTLNGVYNGFSLELIINAGARKYGGFVFQIDPNSVNPTFTKANTHTFGIDLEISWARA